MGFKVNPKDILKQSLESSPLCLKNLNNIKELLHPSTIEDAKFLVHALQQLFIAEYARFTEIKDELNLR